ncbi:MAG TPA: hypothetical protein VFL72_06195, partial [Acidimicrobiia bacterium]|nr:hypothetical protein [Acidimicrobiia bacterium]
SMPIRPGPGLVARLPVDVPAPPAPEVDPIDVFRPEPVVSVPAAPEPVEEEPIEFEPAASELPEPVEEEPFELEPAAIEWPEPIHVTEPIEVFEPEPVEVPEPVSVDEPEPEKAPAVPELVSELLATSSDDDREETPKRLVVDLGAYEAPGPVSTPTQPRVPALAATAPATDKSGIFGAVRAAFVRNKGSHEHEFVEAPGGIGIHRNICSECGYISIGVSESDTE